VIASSVVPTTLFQSRTTAASTARKGTITAAMLAIR
jgi:hypothetical protein